MTEVVFVVPIYFNPGPATIKKLVSKEELSEPIVNFLIKHNINRACWTINDDVVDVKKIFNYYGHNSLTFCGSKLHISKCDTENCDLVTYVGFYDGVSRSDYSRRIECNFKFIDYNNPIYFGNSFKTFQMTSKNDVFKIYSVDQYMDKKTKLRSQDVDIYCIAIKNYQNRLKEIDFIKLPDSDSDSNSNSNECGSNTDNNINVANFDKPSEDFHGISLLSCEYKYAVSNKLVSSVRFNEFVIKLPMCISDIIYEYANIESKEPSRIDNLTLPLICSKQKFLEMYLEKYISINQQIDRIDLDLWFGRYNDFEQKTEIIKIQNNDDFILYFFCKNGKKLCDQKHFDEYGYLISKKIITSQEFNKLLNFSSYISNLIYVYVDFESRKPTLFEIIEKFEIIENV